MRLKLIRIIFSGIFRDFVIWRGSIKLRVIELIQLARIFFVIRVGFRFHLLLLSVIFLRFDGFLLRYASLLVRIIRVVIIFILGFLFYFFLSHLSFCLLFKILWVGVFLILLVIFKLVFWIVCLFLLRFLHDSFIILRFLCYYLFYLRLLRYHFFFRAVVIIAFLIFSWRLGL